MEALVAALTFICGGITMIVNNTILHGSNYWNRRWKFCCIWLQIVYLQPLQSQRGAATTTDETEGRGKEGSLDRSQDQREGSCPRLRRGTFKFAFKILFFVNLFSAITTNIYALKTMLAYSHSDMISKVACSSGNIWEIFVRMSHSLLKSHWLMNHTPAPQGGQENCLNKLLTAHQLIVRLVYEKCSRLSAWYFLTAYNVTK